MAVANGIISQTYRISTAEEDWLRNTMKEILCVRDRDIVGGTASNDI